MLSNCNSFTLHLKHSLSFNNSIWCSFDPLKNNFIFTFIKKQLWYDMICRLAVVTSPSVARALLRQQNDPHHWKNWTGTREVFPSLCHIITPYIQGEVQQQWRASTGEKEKGSAPFHSSQLLSPFLWSSCATWDSFPGFQQRHPRIKPFESAVCNGTHPEPQVLETGYCHGKLLHVSFFMLNGMEWDRN